MNSEVNNLRSLGSVITDIKDELKQFVETRVDMLKSELREKTEKVKLALPLAITGVLLLGTAYLMIMLTIAAAIAWALQNRPYRWVAGFGAVALLCAIVGGIAAYFAKREFELGGIMPVKTIGVLKGDKLWMQSEVRSQI